MLNESRSVSGKKNPNKGEFHVCTTAFFSQVNDITFHIIMGSKSVTFGEEGCGMPLIKTCADRFPELITA